MAFLLFAYMKQSLKLRIDRGSYRLANLTNRINDLNDQISVMNQAKDASDNMAKQTLAMMTNAGNSIFQNILDTANYNLTTENTKYHDLMGQKADEATLKTQADKVDAARDALDQATEKVRFESNNFQAQLVAMNAGANSIFQSQTKAQIDYLQHEETSLDSEKASLETQLKAWQAQYDSYEKAEDSAAKDLAPKFGLS